MKYSKYINIALISFSLIALEIVWTRIFSAEFYYTFAFLILSVAILGLGLGGLALRLFKKLNTERFFRISLLASGMFILIGPIIIFQIGLDFSLLYLDFLMTLKFVFAVIILATSFFFGGIALTYILKNNSKDISKLYMADLIGAGIGVLLVIFFMNIFGTPKTATYIAIPIFIIAFLNSQKTVKTLSIIFVLFSFIISIFSDSLLEIERKDRGRLLSTHWDAMSKIRVVEYNEFTKGIRIDNAAQTSVYRFEGDFNSTKFKFDVNIANLIHRFDSCVFLSLGAGGGVDVLHALQEGAAEIHAVEVNPYINYLLEYGELSEYSGFIYKDPRVKVITEDARTYVRRFENKFDIIYAISSNSFAALASGAFALAENYLFTTEAVEDYWNAMSENGYLIMEHHFYIPRMISSTIEALQKIGVRNPNEHFAVYNLPYLKRNVLLLSKRLLDEGTIKRAFGITLSFRDNYIYPLYPAHDSIYTNLANQIVLQGWKVLQDDIQVDISPCSDDRPFIAQMGMWKNLDLSGVQTIQHFEFTGFPVSKLNIVVILAIVLILIIPLNIIPYKVSKEKLKAVPWLYFFSIGMGFMAVEVILIQKYTLFIGPSVYSLSAILFTLLICSGIGSRFSNKLNINIIFIGIIFWIVVDIIIFTPLTYTLGNLEMLPRILLTGIFIAPLGFLMGMPFPKAGLKVGSLIDWGFAVNGAASVFGSTLIILFALSYGYTLSLIAGAICYLFAYLLISIKKKW
ncbi:MAG: hypothetical protein V1779_16630 [bacterium]